MRANAVRRAKRRETAQRASLIFDRLAYKARRQGLTWPHYDGTAVNERKAAEARAARDERIEAHRRKAAERFHKYRTQTLAEQRQERKYA